MFVLLKLRITDEKGRTAVLSRAPSFEGTAAAESPGIDTGIGIGIGIGIELSWQNEAGGPVYLILQADSPPDLLTTRVAEMTGGEPLVIDAPVSRFERVNMELGDRMMLGPSSQDILMSLPPDVTDCVKCGADLTIEDHRRPPCP
jgi:hypothetical protein